MTDMPIVSDIFRLSSRRPCYAGCVSAEDVRRGGLGKSVTIRKIRRTGDTIVAAGARNNFAQQVIRSTYVQSDSHRILFAFLYRCNPLYKNI